MREVLLPVAEEIVLQVQFEQGYAPELVTGLRIGVFVASHRRQAR